MNRRVSQQDIARAANVSKMTASLALRSDASIRPATRERIQAIAREMGYRHDPVLASIASRKFKGTAKSGIPIALMVGDGVKRTEEFNIVTEHASYLGYRLDCFDIRDAETPWALGEMLHARRYQGILLHYLRGYGTLPELPWDRFSVVVIGHSMLDSLFHEVRWSQFRRLHTGMRELRARGYRRIGIWLGAHQPTIIHDRRRQAAAMYVVHQQPAEDRVPPRFVPFRTPWQDCLRYVREHRLNGLITLHGGFLHLLRREGYRVPEEFGMVSLEIRSAIMQKGQLSGISAPWEVQANKAVEVLDSQLRLGLYGPQESPGETVLPGHWIEGTTVRPRKQGVIEGKTRSAIPQKPGVIPPFSLSE